MRALTVAPVVGRMHYCVRECLHSGGPWCGCCPTCHMAPLLINPSLLYQSQGPLPQTARSGLTQTATVWTCSVLMLYGPVTVSWTNLREQRSLHLVYTMANPLLVIKGTIVIHTECVLR